MASIVALESGERLVEIGMDTYSITAVHVVDDADWLVADARARYKAEFPGRTARRMTHLGMMATLCLRKLTVQRTTPVVYGSAYAESESLEKFIDSFPEASPALFQTSIHPSAVEQGLIPGRQAVDRFYPVTGDFNLAGKALENCIVLADSQVILIGGEERGTWLREHGLANESSFAFGLSLERGFKPGLGRLTVDPSQAPDSVEAVDLESLFSAIANRMPLELPSFGLGATLRVEWR